MWDFELVAICKSEPPENEAKGPWYHYTIANKITAVNGCRRGSKAEVKQFIDSTLKRLNARHMGSTGRQSISL